MAAHIPIIASAITAWQFFISHWRTALTYAALQAGVALAFAALSPTAAGAVVFMGYLFITLSVQAALIRLALGKGAPGLGLRLGKDEFNILISAVVLTVVISFMLFLTFLGLAILMQLFGVLQFNEAGELQPLSNAQLLYVQIAGLAVVILAMSRFCLVFVDTVATGRLRPLHTWSWTKGEAIRIIGCYGLTAGPMQLISFAIVLLAPANPFFMFLTMIITLPVSALSAGLTAHLYRGLQPSEDPFDPIIEQD